MNRTTLAIEGMSCGHCVASVKKTLDRMESVVVDHVALGNATVEYDPTVVSPDEIAAAVTGAGYTAAPSA